MATRTPIAINSVGTIGEARIISADGSTRVAHIGEKVFPREMIMTAANAAVHFQLEDGRLLDVGQESEMTMSADAGASNMMLAAAAPASAAGMQAAIPAGSKVVGTITVVVGNVKIVSVDGVPRVAQLGDKVHSKETLASESDGIVQVQLENGKSIDLGGDSKLALTDAIVGGAGDAVSFVPDIPAPGPAPEQDVAAIQAAIAAGQDPSQVAAETAAGSRATPVVIDQSSSTGEVTSGFPTQPAGTVFPEIRPDVLPKVRANFATGLALSDGIVIHPDPGYSRGGIDNAIVPDPSSLSSELLLGGGGADFLVYDPADLSETPTTVYSGGSGDHTSRFEGSSQLLNVTALADTRALNIRTIDLNGTVDDTLALNVQDVLDLSNTTNLLVMGNAEDVVNAPGQGWLTVGAPVSISGQMYQTYTDGSGATTLLVDTDVSRNIF